LHPILTQPRRLALYVCVWAAFGLLLSAMLVIGEQAPLMWSLEFAPPLGVLLGFQALSCWYLIQALPASETPWPKLVGTWIGTGIVLIAIWLAFALWWAQFLQTPNAQTQFDALSTRVTSLLLFSAAVALSLAILSHYLVVAFERSRTSEKNALQWQVLQREAELRSLRSQLDPHFLFNSLNSVAALIGTDVVAARRMCFLMAGFFRKSVSLGREESIALREEMELIETFLAIEEVRFGDRLRKQFDIAEDTLKFLVPPLVLQPLVENAVHHGIAHLLEGGAIMVTARLRDNLLELVVENACDPDRPPSKGTGTGLTNVRARLETVYGHQARVESEIKPNQFRVTLLMPAIAPASALASAAS